MGMTFDDYMRPATRGWLRRGCARCRRRDWRWRMWRADITGLYYCDSDDGDPQKWEECVTLWAERLRADARVELAALEEARRVE